MASLDEPRPTESNQNPVKPHAPQKREIPNNDAPFKLSRSGVVTTRNLLQLKQSTKTDLFSGVEGDGCY
jgi:hypothetical protein